jgi:hypothetical protein
VNRLALTTGQVRVGLLIDTPAGPRFMTWQLATASVAAFALAVVMRLALDTAAAQGLLLRLVWANIAYHLWVLSVGVNVVTKGLRDGIFPQPQP